MEPDYENLPDEMKFNLALKLDYKTLIDYCKTSSEFLEGICGDNYFWKRKTYYDFGDLYNIEPTKVLYGVADLYEDFEGDWWETYQYYRSVFSRNFIEHLQAENVEAILDDLDLIEEREFLIVDEKTQRKDDDVGGVTALMAAIEKGYEDIADFLLAEGADIEAKDNKGQTVLMKAVLVGNRDIVDFLLAEGADIEAKDNKGQTVLVKAVLVGNRDIVDFLLLKGADVNVKDNLGITPLIDAVDTETQDIVDLLLLKGADPNLKDGNGWTALMLASALESAEIISRLLEAGANPNIIDNEGKTALDQLREYAEEESLLPGDDDYPTNIEIMLQNAMSR